MKKSCLVILLLMLYCQTTFAANWVAFPPELVTAKKLSIYYDVDSVRKSGDRLHYWELRAFASGAEWQGVISKIVGLTEVNLSTPWQWRTVTYFEYDTSGGETTGFDRNGKRIPASENREPTPWSRVWPGSSLEKMVKIVLPLAQEGPAAEKPQL